MPMPNLARVAEQIAHDLRRLSYNQSLSMTIDEFFVRLGAEDRSVYHERGTWASIQRGTREWRFIRKAGLVVNFQPDATGAPVKQVTFRLDRFREPNEGE